VEEHVRTYSKHKRGQESGSQYKRAPGFAAHPCLDDGRSKGQADGKERHTHKYSEDASRIFFTRKPARSIMPLAAKPRAIASPHALQETG